VGNGGVGAGQQPQRVAEGTVVEDSSVVIGYTEKGDQMRVGVSEFQGKTYLGLRLYYWNGMGWAPGKQGVSLPFGADWTVLRKAAERVVEIAKQGGR
jgi:hypothetical protein